MKEIDFVIWHEGDYFVSQCLNIDVSSFGNSIEEATKNLKEALELRLENENISLTPIDSITIGKETIRA